MYCESGPNTPHPRIAPATSDNTTREPIKNPAPISDGPMYNSNDQAKAAATPVQGIHLSSGGISSWGTKYVASENAPARAVVISSAFALAVASPDSLYMATMVSAVAVPDGNRNLSTTIS